MRTGRDGGDGTKPVREDLELVWALQEAELKAFRTSETSWEHGYKRTNSIATN